MTELPNLTELHRTADLTELPNRTEKFGRTLFRSQSLDTQQVFFYSKIFETDQFYVPKVLWSLENSLECIKLLVVFRLLTHVPAPFIHSLKVIVKMNIKGEKNVPKGFKEPKGSKN